MTNIEIRGGAVLLAFLAALFALLAAPTVPNQVLNTRSGGCPGEGEQFVAAGQEVG